jgi:hypothetical protein
VQAKNALAQTHGRAIMLAVLNGFAGVAPRSANPNLIEIMSAMMQHFSQECKMWIPEVFASVSDAWFGVNGVEDLRVRASQDQFVQSKAGQDVKDKFYKALIRCVVRSRAVFLFSTLFPALDLSGRHERRRNNSRWLLEGWKGRVLDMQLYRCSFWTSVYFFVGL